MKSILQIFFLLCVLSFASVALGDNDASDGTEPRSVEQRSIITDGPLKDFSMIFFVMALATAIFAVYVVVSRHLIYLPESVATIIVGILFGVVLRYMGWKMNDLLRFNPSLFFYFVLPPIIYEAGYNLPIEIFMNNLFTILAYAVGGTLISMIVVSAGIFFLQPVLGYSYGLLDSLAFGALISATDPVATLSIFHSLEVDKVLYMLVFGESVLNDAVAIVLYRTVTSHMSLFIAVVDFFYILIGSTAVGCLVGCVNAVLYKVTKIKEEPQLSLALMMLFSYLPYLIGESLRMSGLIAIFFCGIVQGHYSCFNMRPGAQLGVNAVFRLVAFLCETSLFLYVGVSVGALPFTLHPGLLLVAFVTCLIGRALNVFPLSFLCNLGRKVKVPMKDQLVVWFSGLRGGVAFGLSITIPDSSPVKQETVTLTLSIVLLTITLLGGGTLPLLQYLKRRSPPVTDVNLTDVELANAQAKADSIEGRPAPRMLSLASAHSLGDIATNFDSLSPLAPAKLLAPKAATGWFARLDGILRIRLCSTAADYARLFESSAIDELLISAATPSLGVPSTPETPATRLTDSTFSYYVPADAVTSP